MARAYANEQSGALADRARNLADYLDAAMPLSLALSRSRLSVSPEIQLAADVGEKTGTLSQSLKKSLEHLDEFERIQRRDARPVLLSGLDPASRRCSCSRS